LKLYEDLSHFFGFTTRFLVGAVFSNREMLALVVEHSLTLVSILSGTFGLQTGLSSVADLLLMLALPYSLLYYIYSLVFRCHLRLSREMHLLFRGRWRLREEDRLSSKTFFLEHVIVGILLLTPLLFLMPTVFVYYLFWALVFFALKIILLQIQMLMVVTELFPLASVWLRYWKPGLFRKSIYLEYEDNAGSLPSSHAAVALTVAFSHEGFLQLALGNAGQIFSVLLSEILSDLKRILLGETLPFLKLVK
jgi:phosphatidylinositol glycan class Q protein